MWMCVYRVMRISLKNVELFSLKKKAEEGGGS
jgi:hypothetical protein